MSDPYERVKGGRLTFKGGSLAASSRSIEKKKNKKKTTKKKEDVLEEEEEEEEGDVVKQHQEDGESAGGGEVYTIDAAKRMKYEQLFPVEAKKFGYQDPKSNFKSVEEALDDRVKKKADRYCK